MIETEYFYHEPTLSKSVDHLLIYAEKL